MAAEQPTEPISRFQIYHALHRAKRLADAAEKYHAQPDVIAKRAEREQKKVERDAAKALQLAQKEERQQRKQAIELAAAAALEKRALSGGCKKRQDSYTPPSNGNTL